MAVITRDMFAEESLHQQFLLPTIPVVDTLRKGDADLRFYITTLQDG